MNALQTDKQLAIIAALTEGNSIRSIERMTGVHRDTIMRLLVRTGEHCATILDESIRSVPCDRLEFDEIWTYLFKKQKRVRSTDPNEFGDQYVFVAIDPVTKLVPSFKVGKRGPLTTWEFVQDVRQRTIGAPQITSDGFKPYTRAIDDAFGADCSYAQLIKSYGPADDETGTYHPSRVVAIFHQVMFGEPDENLIGTSIVERNNLTIRMQMRRFTRLTNAFSKKLENLKAALSLHFAWYNFVRIHSSLRVTPAMAAGIVAEVWPMSRLMSA